MNNITIHQAFYGEVTRAHGLIQSTLDDPSLRTFLTGFTDRPMALPAGVILETYHSGMAHGDYYIFTRTFPDTTAQRPGMVFTHALIIETKDLEYVMNLEALFEYFVTSRPTELPRLSPLQIPADTLKPAPKEKDLPAYIVQTTDALMNGSLPAIFCGSLSTFTNTIAILWQGLPVPFQKKLSFTAGFSTVNVDGTKTLIHFQRSLLPTLKNSAAVVDENNELMEVDSTHGKYLLHPQQDSLVSDFIEALQVQMDSWSVLQSCFKAYELYQQFKQLKPDTLKQLVRQIAKISPTSNQGAEVKSKLINRFVETIETGEERNFKSLRNLPLDAFPQAEAAIKHAISQALSATFVREDLFPTAEIAELYILLAKDGQRNWWHESLENIFKTLFKQGKEATLRNTWQLLIYSEDSQRSVLNLISQDDAIAELFLISSPPATIPPMLAKPLAAICLKRKWLLLHAHVIQSYLSAKEAALYQFRLELPLPNFHFQGTLKIVPSVMDGQLLSLVLDNNHIWLSRQYAKRCITNSTLLQQLNINNDTWLEVWAESLKETQNIEYGIHQPANVIADVLSRLADNKAVPEEIIKRIANSKYADISTFKQRDQVWQNIPQSYKQLFLRATADGFFERFINNDVDVINIEQELNTFITADSYMTTFLRNNRDKIETVLNAYEKIPGLRDDFLADYINYYSKPVPQIQSNLLGILVLSKRMPLTAKRIFEKAVHREDFRIALNRCQSLLQLTFWEKFRFGHLLSTSLSTDDIYNALQEIAIHSYPHGPEDNNIWGRAGGDLSKLNHHNSREENWQVAMYLLRKGGGGKNISPKSLIKAMQEDYPANQELNDLYKYFK